MYDIEWWERGAAKQICLLKVVARLVRGRKLRVDSVSIVSHAADVVARQGLGFVTYGFQQRLHGSIYLSMYMCIYLNIRTRRFQY